MTTNRLNALSPHMGAALKVARNMVGEQDAHDVVQDAVLAICGKADRDGVDEDVNWLALLLTYTRWAGLDWLKKRREIEHFEGTEFVDDYYGRGDAAAMDEDAVSAHGGTGERSTPAWPTAIEYTTPEQLVTAAELRDLIREIAVARHGARDYAIFCAVTMDGKSQEEVAKVHDITQSAVSRIVMHVRTTLAGELAALGYDVT